MKDDIIDSITMGFVAIFFMIGFVFFIQSIVNFKFNKPHFEKNTNEAITKISTRVDNAEKKIQKIKDGLSNENSISNNISNNISNEDKLYNEIKNIKLRLEKTVTFK